MLLVVNISAMLIIRNITFKCIQSLHFRSPIVCLGYHSHLRGSLQWGNFYRVIVKDWGLGGGNSFKDIVISFLWGLVWVCEVAQYSLNYGDTILQLH